MINILKSTSFLFLIALALLGCKESSCEYTECGGSGLIPKIDLIVLIDGSGSMTASADSCSRQADLAIQDAIAACPGDLRVVYLVMGSTWPGTKFTSSHRTYLTALHGPSVILAVDRAPGVHFEREQGANGIEDLSNLFDWREGACRSIFYISDEELNSIMPPADYAAETIQTQLAIDAANANGVTVSANYLTYQLRGPSILQNYQDLTSQTGGQLFDTPLNPLPSNYYSSNQVFNTLVCNACSNCIIGLAH